jgi:hypothetical protein
MEKKDPLMAGAVSNSKMYILIIVKTLENYHSYGVAANTITKFLGINGPFRSLYNSIWIHEGSEAAT